MRDRTQMIKEYLPEWIATKEPIKSTIAALGVESGTAFDTVDELLRQFSVDTATEKGLPYWEEFAGINTDISKAIEDRRSVIKSKLRGAGTITVNLIKSVAESYANGQVNVIEDNDNYQFTVKFVSTKGIPPNLEDLKNAIEEIKPTHLKVNYSFTFTTWGEVKNITWDVVKTGTWEQLKTREIV
jgi:hypothetical protein